MAKTRHKKVVKFVEHSLLEYLKKIEDPRDRRGLKHSLVNVLATIIIGLLMGKTQFAAIERYTKAKIKTMRKLFGPSYTVPSDSTMTRVLRLLDYTGMYAPFLFWINEIIPDIETLKGRVSIDGKAIRSSRGSENRKDPYVVNAIADIKGLKLVLAMEQVGKKTNELNHILPIMNVVGIENKVVTLDAMGTQAKIMEEIVRRNAKFMLPVKNNQKGLKKECILEMRRQKKPLGYYDSGEEISHGRIERRQILVVEKEDLHKTHPLLKHATKICLVRRETTKVKTGEYSEKEIYYITNCDGSCEELLDIVRDHWKCESSHYILDERFKEDRCTAKKEHELENFALLRRIAFNLVQLTCVRKGLQFCEHDSYFSHTRQLREAIFEPLPQL